MVYEGFATMYMTMPMSNHRMPIQGSCQVEGKDLVLKFTTTTLTLGMPSRPEEGCDDMSYGITFDDDKYQVEVKYISKLRAFGGKASAGGKTVLKFVFFGKDSPMTALKQD